MKDELPPSYTSGGFPRRRTAVKALLALLVTTTLVAPVSFTALVQGYPALKASAASSARLSAIHAANVDRCLSLDILPGPPRDHANRTTSDRFVPGTKPFVVRNATVWTGGHHGTEVLYGADVLLDRGLVKSVSKGGKLKAPHGAVELEAHGAWLTPGIFDMHSHIGVSPLPDLSGADDTNSVQKPILPYLRSLDGFNTHDLAFRRTVAGGVTTSLVLPGSANNIGGQAFVFKLRDTVERTPESRGLELPYNIAGLTAKQGKNDPPRWRHMKMACGENIRRVYKQTRLDLSWNFRSAFEEARKLKNKQDDFCAGVKAGVKSDERFPDDLEWEALVDVLRGKVKVNTHCYEQLDLADFIRHTHEFKFPLAAFHHAHEAYTVPDLLKSAYGNVPAVAIFATNGRYKREAWWGSEWASKILSEQNITVILKSDHPVLDSRYLLFEAQQAHHFGLAENLAIRGVTTAPAETAGFGHRLGYVRAGNDADIVLWDSHPLQLGATPQQVWIDGIPQLDHIFPAKATVSPALAVAPPQRPVTKEELKFQEDDPALEDRKPKVVVDVVKFANVSEVFVDLPAGLMAPATGLFEVLVRRGQIECVAPSCALNPGGDEGGVRSVDLKGGSIFPPLIAFGPALGLTDIISEKSTSDNGVFDPVASGELSTVQQLWGPRVAIKAIDGLSLDGRHLRTAHEIGIAGAVTAPMGDGLFRGVSVAFATGARNALEAGAIVKSEVALHVTIGHYKLAQRPSISTQVAELRALLLEGLTGNEDSQKNYFYHVTHALIPLVVNIWKADHIASIIRLKKEIEALSGTSMRWVVHGGQEAHLVAHALVEANIGVILSPPRAIPESWDERRVLPGPPLTAQSNAAALQVAGVKIALGVPEEWQTRTLVWEAAWVHKSSNGAISRKQAIDLLSSNLVDLLGLRSPASNEWSSQGSFVAFASDPFEFGAKAVAIGGGAGTELL